MYIIANENVIVCACRYSNFSHLCPYPAYVACIRRWESLKLYLQPAASKQVTHSHSTLVTIQHRVVVVHGDIHDRLSNKASLDRGANAMRGFR